MGCECGDPIPVRLWNPIPPIKLFWECGRQFVSILPTFLILTSGSLQYSWTVIWSLFQFDIYLVISWFIGGIIGAFMSSCLINILPKRVFCWVAGVLSVGSGVILVVKPEHLYIIVGQYLSGISYGLAFVPGIIHAAEISEKRVREAACSLVDLGVVLALFIGSILFLTPVDLDVYHGGLCIGFAVAGLIGSLWIIESPVYHLIRGNAAQAEENLKKLRNSTVTTPDIFKELEQTRTLISDSTQLSWIPFSEKNIGVVSSVALLRVVYALSLSLPFIVQFILWLMSFSGGRWPIFIVLVPRFVAEIITGIYIAKIDGLTLTCKTLLPSGLLLLIFATVLVVMNFFIYLEFLIFCILAYQLDAGMGLRASSAACLGQSFPIVKKRWSIFVVFTIEMLVHIMANCLRTVGDYYIAQFFLLGSLSFIVGFGVYGFLVLQKEQIREQMQSNNSTAP